MRGTLAPRSTRRRPFDPRSIPGCVGWFDGNDVGYPLIDAAVVDTWRDKSGGGRDLTQSGTARPALKLDIQNGLSVVRFDGANDYMSTTAAGLGDMVSGTDLPFAVFLALAPSSVGTAFSAVSFADAAANANLRFGGTTGSKWQVTKLDDAAATVNTASSVSATNAWHVISVSGPGTTVDMIVDGVSQASATSLDIGATTTTRFALGAQAKLVVSAFMAGDIGECIVYNRYLSSAEQQAVQKYLGRKWGVFL